jgi:hypothetical protein
VTDIEAAARRAIAFGLIQDRIKTADTMNRQDLQQGMVVTDRKAVVLPLQGVPTVVGSVTLAKGAVYASVTDEAALLEWAETNRPDAVTVVTTKVLAPWLRDELLAVAKRDGDAVDANGELIPGITVREGSPTVKVIRDKSDGAQAAVLSALFADGAAGLRAMLALEAGPE